MTDSNPPLTIYLSLTSSPSTPRAALTLDHNGTTGAELRRNAAQVTTVPLEKLKLIFRGRVISDKDEGDVVKEYRLEEGSVVHVMGKPVAAAAGAAAGATAASAAPATAGASVTLPAVNNMSIASGAGSASPLAAALTKLRSSNDGTTYRTALVTADKLMGNIVSHPMEVKYRNIKKANPAFARRLGALPGGSDLILASGFTVQTKEAVEYYVLTPSADAWPKLVDAQKEVQRVLGENSASVNVGGFGANVNAANNNNAAPAANLFPGGIPSGAMGGGGSGADMMQSMMSDPNMMQNVMGMMNNPMVQNMMRNDPRIANNPMMQQSLNALQSNPEMMNQVSQMMSDPTTRDRMMNMMQQQQGGAGAAGGGGGAGDPFANGPEAMQRQMEQFAQMSQQFGGSSGGFNTGGGTGTGTASGGQSGAANNNGSAGMNDNEQTEEEMIAEAIARSLRES
mmetsp:Transcript_6084/g.13786  ORF Transcript_6084/g.13786 Transcript_6084/m.13786 type:complete len:454 (-) Transcript_6084:121-1482(-)|eukprot:CAMPEP_0172307972 /NCGR_PEP_ID=MMETSP1058-20130122/8710_1 /TAXON_ID=83371 /ORGANISM="Detonula confervacea, Strain CCMP 353" /LENGTH=453 /DNA_ID=CAMNT_0013020293 /DNA_START=65 /DNA_END=1426 /DNA_ORIENTATION=-